ncbi:ribosomal protection-like ABC-F family protein [Clostridium sp. HBUAS56017]|uniref:ribosomal protection-like ABC-F family protein n=1 Tax=Clostridium sp. HBUAS56017 TaxID=2571128 RepID=UPI001177D966|nr:ABC-F type ribosomal protection protein [Clostridium sp. HBUAS56017]
MIELALNKLQKYYGGTIVLEDINFEVQTSEKVGIVGENGCGKSTLLKIIMGKEDYENGSVSIKKGATLGYLEQVPVYPDRYKVIDVLNTAFEEVDLLGKELELLERELSSDNQSNIDKLLRKLSDLQVTYESLGGYEKEEKLSKVCTGLKINDEMKESLFSDLSGGEKTTIILGKILLQNPDILLLDEPSNHLDLESIEWLERYLKEYKGIVLIVSHDRYFLDNVVTKIVEIEDEKSKTYEGNYTAYQVEKEKQLKLQMDAFQEQQKKIKAMEKSITKLRDWAIRADNNKFFRRAASMQKQLDKIQRIDKPVMERDSININNNSSQRSGNDVVIVKDLCKSFGKKVLFNKAELLIKKGEAVALIGQNGSGKSTMIKILLEMEKADAGHATLGSSIKLGYLPQNISFVDENKTILECFREDIVISEGKAREYLAKYMFFGEVVFKKVKTLSGGERSRLKLAILMFNEVNLLILDEPTNHLDIYSREELESFLKEFNGTLLFISHDRYFINRVATRVVELYQGVLVSYDGDYEYYKEKSLELKNMPQIKTEEKIVKKEKQSKSVNGKVNQWKKENLEKQIESIEESLKDKEEKINRFCSDYEKLNILYAEKLELEKKLEKIMEEYFDYL